MATDLSKAMVRRVALHHLLEVSTDLIWDKAFDRSDWEGAHKYQIDLHHTLGYMIDGLDRGMDPDVFRQAIKRECDAYKASQEA